MLEEYCRSKGLDDSYIFFLLIQQVVQAYPWFLKRYTRIIPALGLLLAVARTARKQKAQLHVSNKLKDLSSS
jgi:hypothetical protein